MMAQNYLRHYNLDPERANVGICSPVLFCCLYHTLDTPAKWLIEGWALFAAFSKMVTSANWDESSGLSRGVMHHLTGRQIKWETGEWIDWVESILRNISFYEVK